MISKKTLLLLPLLIICIVVAIYQNNSDRRLTIALIISFIQYFGISKVRSHVSLHLIPITNLLARVSLSPFYRQRKVQIQSQQSSVYQILCQILLPIQYQLPLTTLVKENTVNSMLQISLWENYKLPNPIASKRQ